MKRSVLILIFWLPYFSFAQNNWAPINTTSKYNYKLDTADYITHTIWVDSHYTDLGVNIFELNTIVKRNSACDSILELAQIMGELNDEYCNLCRAWKNQPQFLQKSIHGFPDGTYLFHDTLDFKINVLAQSGEMWLYDSANAVIATVINASTDSVLGAVDSVKTILLSTGDTIMISKESGILLFPDANNSGTYYRLAGTENPNRGEIVPGFWQMYDYNVGGVFCIHSSELFFDGETFTTKKSVIFEKDSSDDAVTYNTHFHSHLFGSGPGWFDTDSATGNENWTFEKTSNDLYSTYYNNQLCSMSNNQYYFLQAYKSQGKYLKKIGVDQNPGFGIYYVESDSIEDLLLPACDQSFESMIFEEGLGSKHYEYSCNFECGSTLDYAYLPDGSSDPDYCLWDFTSVEDKSHVAFAIFPNPTYDFLYLKTTGTTQKELSYQILDNIGRTILVGKTEKEINVQTLSPGYYRIVIEDMENRAFIKF